jgi:transcriptional regulator with XRE-family HTH domain
MKALREIRKARKLTTKSCANALGVVESTWVRWETGGTDPGPTQRNAIADMLGVTLDQLAGRQDFDQRVALAS